MLILIIVAILGFYIFLCMKKNKEDNIPIEDKISQMLIIGYSDNPEIKHGILDDIANNKVSGIIFYRHQIKSPESIKKKIDELNARNLSQYPLFIVVDQEGGKVSRIADENGFKTYPSAKDIALKYTLDQAYQVYYEMAQKLKNVGFNFNLAPCVDVNTNSSSFIASRNRICSSNPEIVYKYSYEFVKAHRDSGILTALKHFPGLGSAGADSHKWLPDITNTWVEEELVPFKKIIGKFPDEPVMLGHVINKKIDAENISSISDKTVAILNYNKNYNGLIVTDAIDMDAVEGIDISEIIIKAINAGVDIFIFPNHVYTPDNSKKYMPPDLFIKIVKDGIENGDISKEDIDKSYKKILKAKQNL